MAIEEALGICWLHLAKEQVMDAAMRFVPARLKLSRLRCPVWNPKVKIILEHSIFQLVVLVALQLELGIQKLVLCLILRVFIGVRDAEVCVLNARETDNQLSAEELLGAVDCNPDAAVNNLSLGKVALIVVQPNFYVAINLALSSGYHTCLNLLNKI